MSVTQYIGARYVPLFADPIDWDNTRQYEPLTIVYYQGNSYTSKQAVPSGVDISNTDYWAITGNYNAQIEQYRRVSQVVADSLPSDDFSSENTVKEYIDDGDSALNTAIQNEVSARQTADANLNTAIQNEVSARQTAITSLSNRVTQTEHIGRVCILIGDSYGEGYTPDGNVDGWCKRASEYLANAGIIAKYAYRGGASLANGYFLGKLQDVVSSMTDAEKVRCDMVVIAGGYNDRNSDNVLQGAKDIANYIRDNLPNAKGILSFVGKCVTGRTTGSHSGATMASVISAWKKWAQAAGQVGLGWDTGAIGTLCQNDMFASDFVHPNDFGLARIARRISTLICYGAADNADRQFVLSADSWQDGDATVYNPKQLLGTINYRGMCDGLMHGDLTSPMQEFRFSTAKSVTLDAGAGFALAYLRTPQTTGISLIFPCVATFHLSAGGFVSYPGRLTINNAGLVRLSCMNSSGTNYTTIEIDRVQVVLSSNLAFT